MLLDLGGELQLSSSTFLPYNKTNNQSTAMKKSLLLWLISFLFISQAFSQTKGSFQSTLMFNGTNHTLAIYVPLNYDSQIAYPLVVALHGCNGNAISFRNGLVSISDSLNAIILCPDFMGNQISGANGQIIPQSILELIDNLNYNIDTTSVYLTGFSCNGQETYKHGWNAIYPFRGIIPFNSWIPNTSGYSFSSKIPTCVCTGTSDGSYNNNVSLYNSLIANSGIGRLNSMAGIGHLWNFAGRDVELMECFHWIDSITNRGVGLLELEQGSMELNIFPNPASDQIGIEVDLDGKIYAELSVYNLNGKKVFSTSVMTGSLVKIDSEDYPSGIYFAEIVSENQRLSKRFELLK